MAINPDTTVRKIVSLPRDLWGKVDDYRFGNRLSTEAEAIRRLLHLGLAATVEGYIVGPDGRLIPKDE